MIHRVRVQNFKSILDVAVDLSPVTVLVGKSGTGKSSFVQALRFLRDVLKSNQIAQQLPQLRPMMAADLPTSFYIEYSVAGVEGMFRYDLLINNRAPHLPASESLSLASNCLFHQETNTQGTTGWLVEPKLLQVPQPGPIAISRIASISEVVIAFTALTSGIGCYAFSDAVLSGSQMGLPRDSGLMDDASNFLGVVKELVTDLQDLKVRRSIVAVLQQVNPSVSSIELNDIQKPSSVVVGHSFGDKTVALNLSQESDGFRRFYAHLLAIYQRPRKQTLIFEHPEDGIHPGALALLAEEFKAAPEQGRGQVILTTHSPQLLDQFDAEQIRVVELADLQTRIGPISPEQKEAIRDGLLEPGELLTVDPARMELEATDA